MTIKGKTYFDIWDNTHIGGVMSYTSWMSMTCVSLCMLTMCFMKQEETGNKISKNIGLRRMSSEHANDNSQRLWKGYILRHKGTAWSLKIICFLSSCPAKQGVLSEWDTPGHKVVTLRMIWVWLSLVMMYMRGVTMSGMRTEALDINKHHRKCPRCKNDLFYWLQNTST